ncbi:ATP-dependent DNA helicase DDM1 [Hyphodiscus hymeniophilus]|uniref:ATP-dependent DNA helicase DDM1 n=1 Tax=Hyphodiscus hymeniophilus TaxID=353542 RepID=A0A9P7AX81_9HELO|nr:ATP-dependent DNA helicase DDM1 [Hyphodiscus hymeniophilus]
MSQSSDMEDHNSSSTPASSPTESNGMATKIAQEKAIIEEEKRAESENIAEERRRKLKEKRRKKQDDSKEAREAKAAELNDLLAKSAVFSQALTKKTQVLGRVGSGLDDRALGEHNLDMAKQPECMVGGTMRGYQLEGLTWMLEICVQGMSGILADEMGLGKTIQTRAVSKEKFIVSLLAHLREKENYLGPHLIVAPLSTLSNWEAEFEKWTPTVPVILYHGTPSQRKNLRSDHVFKNLSRDGRPNLKFPVVLTSPEIVIRDEKELCKVNWEMIIIDEGHRLKNSEAKLFRILQSFRSATRLLITGTPLQNNLKELWSLLNFLLPKIFTNWEQFESWFDFSDLEDEDKTKEFLEDQMKQDLVKKMHVVLQPLLLRRVKADVEHLLPKKREYILYAPMTRDQTDLYNAFRDKAVDARQFLENKIFERLAQSVSTSRSSSRKVEESDSEDDAPLALRMRPAAISNPVTPKNAFQTMMAKKASANDKPNTGSKRKAQQTSAPASKSAKSSRGSTPGSIRSSRSAKSRGRKAYQEVDVSEDDAMSDDELESKMAADYAAKEGEQSDSEQDPEEIQRQKTMEHAKKEISGKKLGNPIMQLRLACNSPHNFYNPWAMGEPIDETLVSSSGKMLLLDRLLPGLFARGHKVLIFSQFKTSLDILEDYARDLRDWNVCRIDGSVSQVERRDQIKQFNEDPEFKLFLLSTRAGGQGINLASADTVILFDSDWNPQQDLQAQDRAHRIGQTRPVVVFRLATKGTVEEKLLLDADAKRRLEKLVIKKGGLNQKLNAESLEDPLKDLLLKDGETYHYSGGEEILSEQDLDILCDRSDAAYVRASEGLGNAKLFKVIETKASGLMDTMKNIEK